MRPAETAGERHVPEWNSDSGMACQGLQRILRRTVAGSSIDQRIDVRTMPVTAVKRVSQHLADDLIVLRRIARNRSLWLRRAVRRGELHGRRHCHGYCSEGDGVRGHWMGRQ